MVLLNEGRYNLETEALLEIALADVDELPASADELIDAFLEVSAVELPGVEV